MITTKGVTGKRKVKVLRPFILGGKVVTKGETIEVPAILALELKAAKKAQIVSAATEAVDMVENSEKPKKGKAKE